MKTSPSVGCVNDGGLGAARLVLDRPSPEGFTEHGVELFLWARPRLTDVEVEVIAGEG